MTEKRRLFHIVLASALGASVTLLIMLGIPAGMEWWNAVQRDREFAAWAKVAVPTLAAEISRLQGLRGGCS